MSSPTAPAPGGQRKPGLSAGSASADTEDQEETPPPRAPVLIREVVCTARGNEALSRPEDSKAAERDGEAWFPSPKQTSVIREDLNVLFQTEEDHQPQEGHVPGEKRPEGTRLPLVWLRRPFSDTAGPRQGPSRALTFTPKLSVPGIPA
uniref:Uncharacterized protein n=1 Tax=Rangifer tarandus platyrhynchus TaxID=3082113 RepID=A0ACB0DPT6_RANTA|nr:unnamed protein product [Rangifer tarandus platyrhynchus]